MPLNSGIFVCVGASSKSSGSSPAPNAFRRLQNGAHNQCERISRRMRLACAPGLPVVRRLFYAALGTLAPYRTPHFTPSLFLLNTQRCFYSSLVTRRGCRRACSYSFCPNTPRVVSPVPREKPGAPNFPRRIFNSRANIQLAIASQELQAKGTRMGSYLSRDSAKPLINCFCSSRNTTSGGILATTAPSISGPKLIDVSAPISVRSPTCTTCRSCP